MAIANTNEVKFLYAANAAKASKEVGVISFAEDTRQILVGTGADAAVAFAGNVKNATFTDGILTIERNSGDNLTLNFKDIASATQTMAAFKSLDDAIKAEAATRAQNDTALDNKITEITGEGGTIDTKVAVEAKAREDADKAITDMIGTVEEGSTLVDMIADAKDTAIAAGTVIEKTSDLLTLESSVSENGATTYKIGTNDVAKASDLTAEIQNRGTAITDAVNELNSSVNDSDASSFVSVSVTETAGKLTEIEVTTNKIANVDDLDDVSTRVKATEDAIDALTGDGAGSVQSLIDAAVDALIDNAPDTMDTFREISEWINNETDGAASMAKQIAKNTEDISTNAKAISDEAAARELADSSIRTDFAAADTQIRADFADADTLVLNAAKEYAKTAVEQTHTHGNKDLLDTYTQTEANLADAVAKKHSHDNKTALDGISSAKVSAWDSAEQNAKNYAKDYADGLAGNYATAAQGSLADSALQPADITSGSANGTISVDGSNVAVTGLGSAAYTEASAYDAAGAANTALTNAKAYANDITVNGQSQSGQAITITGNDIEVGGEGNHKTTKLSTSIEDLYTKVNEAQNAGVQSIAVASDSSAFAAVDKSTGAVSFSVKTVALNGLTDSSANGLVDAKTVKAYVDAAESRATLKWIVA